ncbi:hypothetical protein GYMLUDRAFT_578119 [Collybiopsis luxurians FD-317 M1]|uniref:Uncharacterized protein n=1 Tax=Collybiopsis luxurians FD-317 M1 TaxID=944289 RepID=A0A0D0CGN2_9AGAR|nr:hypothetical protein GYMLUDRAFT_578119 [Collybiopsis luxurians FD-317 M1]
MKRKYGGSPGSTDGHGSALRTFGDASAAAAGGGLFAWFRSKKNRPGPLTGDHKTLGNYELTARTSPTSDAFPTEDALRQMRYRAYLAKERLTSEYTVNSDLTRVGGDNTDSEDGEMGWRKKTGKDINEKVVSVRSVHQDTFDREQTLTRDADWDPAKDLDWNRDTLVGLDSLKHQKNLSMTSARDMSMSPERRPMMHIRQLSDVDGPQGSDPMSDTLGHTRGLSLSRPLLQLPEAAMTSDTAPPPLDHHDYHERGSSNMDFGEFGAGGLAGIGSARRNERLRSESLDVSGDVHFRSSSVATVVERPPSSLSTGGSERGRPLRSPSGPRQSTLSSHSSILRD